MSNNTVKLHRVFASTPDKVYRALSIQPHSLVGCHPRDLPQYCTNKILLWAAHGG